MSVCTTLNKEISRHGLQAHQAFELDYRYRVQLESDLYRSLGMIIDHSDSNLKYTADILQVAFNPLYIRNVECTTYISPVLFVL